MSEHLILITDLSLSFSLGLVKKYYQVLQRYYVQYLSGYDADMLNQLIQVCYWSII